MFGDRIALIDGATRRTYEQFADRCERLAGATTELALTPGDRVSVLAPNVEMPLEATFGFPLAGVVLNALNMRLSADELAYIVGHAGSKVRCVDHELASVGEKTAADVEGLRIVVSGGENDEYESLISGADPHRVEITDESKRNRRRYGDGYGPQITLGGSA